jgi:HK97 family phage prohead protease
LRLRLRLGRTVRSAGSIIPRQALPQKDSAWKLCGNTGNSDDVCGACFHHDEMKTFGKTCQGNVLLQENDHGLWFEVDLQDSPMARQVVRYMKIGKMRFSSASVMTGERRLVKHRGKPVIEHTVIKRLDHISLTCTPAFVGTSARLVSD